jgi:hypothetical protein
MVVQYRTKRKIDKNPNPVKQNKISANDFESAQQCKTNGKTV